MKPFMKGMAEPAVSKLSAAGMASGNHGGWGGGHASAEAQSSCHYKSRHAHRYALSISIVRM
jgi:hypothetical protein